MLELFVIYRQITGLAILHAKCALLELCVLYMNPDLNALFTQKFCSTSQSAYGVCALCAFP